MPTLGQIMAAELERRDPVALPPDGHRRLTDDEVGKIITLLAGGTLVPRGDYGMIVRLIRHSTIELATGHLHLDDIVRFHRFVPPVC